MDTTVAAAVLAAALLHASWHALVKTSGDRTIALAGMNVVSGTAAAVLLPFVTPPPPLVLALIGGSVLLHGAYKVALAGLYSRSELSQGYPVARGATPVIAALLAAMMLREIPTPLAGCGIVAISLGIVALSFERRAAMSLRTLGMAFAAGACVAAYSAVDAYGVRMNGDWLGFTVWLVALDSAAFVAYTLAVRRRKAVDAWIHGWGKTVVSGLLGVASFAVFMWALGRAQVGAVTALRETSVLFATLIGALVLKEKMSPERYACAGLVMGGAAAIALSR